MSADSGQIPGYLLFHYNRELHLNVPDGSVTFLIFCEGVLFGEGSRWVVDILSFCCVDCPVIGEPPDVFGVWSS